MMEKNTKVFEGETSLSELSAILDACGHQAVLLVTGQGSYYQSGAASLLAASLRGRRVVRVSEFNTNPNKKDLVKILKQIEGVEYTALIAIGGGSVIDMAKLIRCFQNAPGRIDAVLQGAPLELCSQSEFYVIPTTAGSGSEATHFAVIYDQGKKYSVGHPRLLADVVWVIPSLLSSAPRAVSAAAAMDALCQGIESYWSIHSTEESKSLAKQAIQLAWAHMEPAVLDRDPESLMAMGRAAHLAGRAINITKTTAPHAVSYALTTHFGILHGHAVGLILPSIFQFNAGVSEADLQDPRGVEHVRAVMNDLVAMLGCQHVDEAERALQLKMDRLHLSRNRQELKIDSLKNCELIVRDGFNPQRVHNNPRRLQKNDLKQILDSILGTSD